MDQPPLGRTLRADEQVGRDAVHVPVFPAVCNVALSPGDKLRITGGKVGNDYLVCWAPPGSSGYDAVVDPFLADPLPPGTRFYAVIRPGAVTGLRHVYTHPAFAPAAPPKEPARG